jgi:hypothetical protein
VSSSELSGAYWEISGEYYVTKHPDPDVTRECKIFSNKCKWTQKNRAYQAVFAALAENKNSLVRE